MALTKRTINYLFLANSNVKLPLATETNRDNASPIGSC